MCKSTDTNTRFVPGRPRATLLPLLLAAGLAGPLCVLADIPGRPTPQGKVNPATGKPGGTAVPLAGTQQQELMNITFPSPYNVFEFPQTCGACHGGTIDQQAGHYGNWAGSVMATTARNPVFRADWIVVNEKIKAAGAGDGAANICARCHIPNAFLSGRTDPYLGGTADGSSMIHQITLSTDDEGISCEFCHRAIGNVVMKQVGGQHSDDPAFNMLKYITDWPHQGDPFPAAGAVRSGLLAPGELYSESPAGPLEGRPMGIATYQINDAMTYAGKYSGVVQVYFSDVPLNDPVTGLPTPYTGQTYGIYPPGWPPALKTAVPFGMPQFNSVGQEVAYNADGSIPVHFEATIGPPVDPVTGAPRPDLQSLSPEHSTHNTPGPNGREPFIRTSEFCGTCHDRTLPPLDLGMPRAKEYTEWKLSYWGGSKFATKADGTPDPEYNPNYLSCQDCHMPTLKHEYSDTVPATLNGDPTVAGWSPYAKDRGPMGGTAFHKFGGANYNLAQMAKVLYPEVDLEVIGIPTGNDTRVFPGIQSSRDLAWDRNIRNDQITMRDAARIEVTQAPLQVGTDALGNGIWEVKVRVTDQSPHRFPTGLPDGRRAWINLVVKNGAGTKVYESGYYDANEAALYNDSAKTYNPAYFAVTGTRFNYAQTPLIDAAAGQNAVMVYERRTGHKQPDGKYQMSYDVSNIYIMFDNRIPPQGFSYAKYDAEGVKWRKFDPATFTPSEDAARFADGQYWDEVTYRFSAPAGATLQARAELLAQTHTRDLLDFLRAETAALAYKGPRPEGPPSVLAANYPLTPTYLSDQVVNYWNAQPGVADISSIVQISDLNGTPLDDTWAGVAYAAWLLSGKASPFVVGADDTTVNTAPAAPTGLTSALTQNPATGVLDPFTIQLTWDLTPNAEGYLVWTRYGKSDLTASWDRLAIVYPPAGATTATFLNEGLNVAKTYGYKVQAFNGKGVGADSTVVSQTTPIDLPIEPLNLRVVAVADTTVTLSWTDQADNEIGFIIERQDVPANTSLPLPNFVKVATIPSQTPGPAFGGNIWTDMGLTPGRTYNYQVMAYNASGTSVPSLPVAATTTGLPAAPTSLAAVAVGAKQVDLTWVDNSVTETGFRIERSATLNFAILQATYTVGANVTAFSDTKVAAGNTYYYRVFAVNALGASLPSNPATVVAPVPPAPPSNLIAVPTGPGVVPPSVTLTWSDNSLNEAGFKIYRKIGTAAFALLTTLGANGTASLAWVDNTVQPGMTYDYRVTSFNSSGESVPLNAAGVVIPGQIPEAPTLLTVSQIGKTSLTLGWVDNSVNEQGFYVEQSETGPTAGFLRVATVKANATLDKVTALKSKTTYWFRVQAFNQDGVSAYTDPVVSATTK